ncbi:myosin a tail domain interacting protein, putative [Theileria equi strain WA]|uniref:Myosin a tail domain interacting protein, putative n=1 Tax=Theileria equi strain WA TaxID=1537102 RepID=L0B0T5_THEEQ|nr:myosin a tail domain interacting protein, putative [Theileria equi strain WA]AFZ80866.1 myosin a tail domain interacting protein, putative [Theileria equi strain WA]|eukprot:XP_004830532.1 myosin a tail domain interacting protein, putative [Theileria equi strain WA]
MLVEGCLGSCYNDLPQPEFVLSPEDSELNYFLWMPGFKYQPTLQKKLTTLKSMSSNSDSTIEDVLEELIEVDEMQSKFNSRASNGFLSVHEAGMLARELGAVPSMGDLLEFETTFGNAVNFEQFKELCAVSMYSKENAEYILGILEQFAMGKSELQWKKLEYILTNYGEPLTDAEMAQVAKVLPLANNAVDCKKMAELVA